MSRYLSEVPISLTKIWYGVTEYKLTFHIFTFLALFYAGSRDSSIGRAKAACCMAGFRVPAWARNISQLYSAQAGSGAQLSLLSNMHVGLCTRDKSDWSVKLTIHLHLVSRSRMVELYPQSQTRVHGVVFK
jgi:hypothetical protein